MNATSTPMLVDLGVGALMPIGRVLRAYANEAKYELLRMLRSPGFTLPFLALPVPMYLFFGVVELAGGRDAERAEGDHVVGRNADLEVVLDLPTVSRQHARISVHNGIASIADLDSKRRDLCGRRTRNHGP